MTPRILCIYLCPVFQVGPANGYSDEDDECNPWDAFAAAMQLMKEKPDASEAEIAGAVSTCYVGGGPGEPEQMSAATERAASSQVCGNFEPHSSAAVTSL